MTFTTGPGPVAAEPGSRFVGEWTGKAGAFVSPPLMDEETRKRQVGGSHYASKPIQPWDIILVYKLDYWEGNALKYLLRNKANRLEDLKKARHYLDESIRQLEACPR